MSVKNETWGNLDNIIFLSDKVKEKLQNRLFSIHEVRLSSCAWTGRQEGMVEKAAGEPSGVVPALAEKQVLKKRHRE